MAEVNSTVESLTFKADISNTLETIQGGTSFTDVIFLCDSRAQFNAHKLILSAQSPFFRNIFLENTNKTSSIIMPGMKEHIIQKILNYIYKGEASVPKDEVSEFMACAEALGLKQLLNLYYNLGTKCR